MYLNEKHNDKNVLARRDGTDGKRLKESNDNIVIDLDKDNCDLRSTVEKVERDLILGVLKRTKGNKTKAGEILGIPRQTLKYKMGRLGIEDVEK